jgi:CDP-diacylglycerol--glycerol-3-phosphate 3-phosphatidyltransferase
MPLPNTVTATRLVLAPVFFVVFFVPNWFGVWSQGSVVVLWCVFAVSELTDALDGSVARRRDQVTDLGKLFDPFADVFSRLTYFVCFMVSGIMPLVAFILILYRELAISFLRLLVYKEGIVMGARFGGKLKSLVYFFSAAGSLVVLTLVRTDIEIGWQFYLGMTVNVLYGLAALLAVVSFLDYARVFAKSRRGY